MHCEAQVWVFRAAAVLAPFVVYFVVRRICDELRSRGGHPLRGWTGRVVRRDPGGGYVTVSQDDGRRD
jgi:hypothetical protein